MLRKQTISNTADHHAGVGRSRHNVQGQLYRSIEVPRRWWFEAVAENAREPKRMAGYCGRMGRGELAVCSCVAQNAHDQRRPHKRIFWPTRTGLRYRPPPEPAMGRRNRSPASSVEARSQPEKADGGLRDIVTIESR